jgi:hypothetical protein
VREYLFRGKRIDNGEWVEGDLLHPIKSFGWMIVPIGVEENAHEVDPSTIGQFTGLTAWEDYTLPVIGDLEPIKIYEGDKLSFATFDYNGTDTIHTGTVYYCGAGFWIDCTETEGDDGVYSLSQARAEDDDMRIIGNIHDEVTT